MCQPNEYKLTKKLLVVVDMQNDFVRGALGTKEAEQIVPNVVKMVQNCRRSGYDVIFTRDTHQSNYLSTQEGANLPVEHCIAGSWGWQIVDELLGYNTHVLDKPTFGSVLLGNYVQKVDYDEVTLIGLCTDICVISNAMLIKAFCPETKVKVVSSCCAGVTPQSHANALEAMKMCQITVE